jgi:hypothetical protein
MGRKRRQRSTAIRKRIEKQQREKDRQARRAAKRAGKEDETVLIMTIDAGVAAACSVALTELGKRLEAGPIRGWSSDDVSGRHGLTWLAGALQEAGGGDERELVLEVARVAKEKLLDQLNGLEMAAPGLNVDWDVGFLDLSRALSQAEEPPPPEEDEEGAEDEDGDGDSDSDEASDGASDADA